MLAPACVHRQLGMPLVLKDRHSRLLTLKDGPLHSLHEINFLHYRALGWLCSLDDIYSSELSWAWLKIAWCNVCGTLDMVICTGFWPLEQYMIWVAHVLRYGYCYSNETMRAWTKDMAMGKDSVLRNEEAEWVIVSEGKRSEPGVQKYTWRWPDAPLWSLSVVSTRDSWQRQHSFNE